MSASATRTKRPTTAADVAKFLGVSRATVSDIMNGREARFPEETRAKVRAAADELDYRPSPAGRSLKTGRSDTIVVVMPDTTIGQNLQTALERLTADTKGIGSNVVLRFADSDPETTAAALISLRPMAVVDFGSLDHMARERLAAQGIPTVPDIAHPMRVDGRGMQDAIAEIQVAALSERGPRQFVYAAIADERPDPYGPARLQGVRSACERRGLAEPLHIGISPTVESATAALGEIAGSAPLAVAAYNDEIALAVMAAASRLGLMIPDDVAVAGVDATNVGKLWHPPLTSVSVDMGAMMAQTLTELTDALGMGSIPTVGTSPTVLTLVPGESS